ncbi:MAG TPA: alpha-glucosidase, partial [Lentzea sp.]
AIMLTAALPGGVYVYQGEELGLWEVEDLPDELREDPVWHRSGFTDRGRDGCRVPLPWSAEDGPSWLPQPESWQRFSVAAQADDPGSMLSLYREVFAQRRGISGDLEWLDLGEDVLAFRRNDRTCVVNLSDRPVDLPATPTLSSVPLTGGQLPPDAAAWL